MEFGTIQDNSGPKVRTEDLVGRPLIVWVNDYKREIGTSQTARTGRLADPVICDIVDLRPPMGSGPILYRNVWIFTGSLIKTFKNLVGTDPRLLVLSQTGNSYGGRSYVITDLHQDPNATEMAKAWVEANPEFVRSDAPPDPPPFVPQAPQQQNQGWPQGSMPAQQWQQGPSPQGQFQQPQYQPQPTPQQQTWNQPQQQWGQQQAPSHHEQGPPPAWAQQPVQQAPPPQQQQYQQPPLPPQQVQQGVAPQSILERLAQQQGQVPPQYNQEQERTQYGY